MRRREIISGIAASTLLTATPSSAALSCTPFNFNGVQRCQVGVNIGSVTTALQNCQNWCWAACAQTIFGIHGYNVKQVDIVKKIYSNQQCATATGSQIIDAITGRWITEEGQSFEAEATALLDMQLGKFNDKAAGQVATELSNDKPLINGALGHATVLTAMQYLRDFYSNGLVESITVRDPWPGNLNKRFLSPAEASNTFFIAKVDVY